MNEVNKPVWGNVRVQRDYTYEASEKENPEETGSSTPQICHQDTTWCLGLICSDVQLHPSRPFHGGYSPPWMVLESNVVAILFGSFVVLLFVACYRFLSLGFLE